MHPQVWDQAVAAGCEPDSRMCTTLLEVCTRKGDTPRALAMYDRMRDAPTGSRLAPSVPACTAARRGAAEGGAWETALDIWNDMLAAGGQPTGTPSGGSVDTERLILYSVGTMSADSGFLTGRGSRSLMYACLVLRIDGIMEPGVIVRVSFAREVHACPESSALHAGHAYAAAISACAVGSVWPRAVELFDEMMEVNIKPDVASCTALISALGSDAQWERAERVVVWMHQVRLLLSHVESTRMLRCVDANAAIVGLQH